MTVNIKISAYRRGRRSCSLDVRQSHSRLLKAQRLLTVVVVLLVVVFRLSVYPLPKVARDSAHCGRGSSSLEIVSKCLQTWSERLTVVVVVEDVVV